MMLCHVSCNTQLFENKLNDIVYFSALSKNSNVPNEIHSNYTKFKLSFCSSNNVTFISNELKTVCASIVVQLTLVVHSPYPVEDDLS